MRARATPMRRSFRTHLFCDPHPQGCTLGWYAPPRWGGLLRQRRNRISSDGECAPVQPRCGVPSERICFAIPIPRVAPWAGMHRPVGAVFCASGATECQRRATSWFSILGGGGSMSVEFPVPQRGTTYQPRVKPWVSDADDPCVLKERSISSDGECVPVQPRCGVPSERICLTIPIPRVAPWAGMHRPVGAVFCANGATAYQRRATPWKEC